MSVPFEAALELAKQKSLDVANHGKIARIELEEAKRVSLLDETPARASIKS